jgi:hypothetical protein
MIFIIIFSLIIYIILIVVIKIIIESYYKINIVTAQYLL